MQATPEVSTFLFTDIEGSSLMWEEDAERMAQAVARHDALLRDVVGAHRGRVVKTTGDGIYAAFVDPADCVAAAIDIQSLSPTRRRPPACRSASAAECTPVPRTSATTTSSAAPSTAPRGS